jgi:hypothetical protein
MAATKVCGVNAGCRQAALANPDIFPVTSLKAEAEMELVQSMYGEVNMCNFMGMIDCNMKISSAGKTSAQVFAAKKACSASSGCAPPRNAISLNGEVNMVCDFMGMMDCNMSRKSAGKTSAQIFAEKKACSAKTGCAPPRNVSLIQEQYQCDDLTMINSIDDLINEIATKGQNELEAAEINRQQAIATVSGLFVDQL